MASFSYFWNAGNFRSFASAVMLLQQSHMLQILLCSNICTKQKASLHLSVFVHALLAEHSVLSMDHEFMLLASNSLNNVISPGVR